MAYDSPPAQRRRERQRTWEKLLPQLSFLSGTCMRQTICMSVAADLGPVHSLGVGSAITCAPIAIDHYSSPRGARGVRILRWGDACR